MLKMEELRRAAENAVYMARLFGARDMEIRGSTEDYQPI
jgi:hypothetical protein